MDTTQTCYICFDTELNEITIKSPCNNCNMYVHYSCLMNYLAMYDNNFFLCSMCHSRYDESVVRDALNVRDLIYEHVDAENNINALQSHETPNYRRYIKKKIYFLILTNTILILLLMGFIWLLIMSSIRTFPDINIFYIVVLIFVVSYFFYFCKQYTRLYRVLVSL